jgi:spoIIIJ-associated protein
MHNIEIRAESMEEARKAAAFQLGVSEEQIDIEIVEEPRDVEGEMGGTFRVRATLREGAFSPREEQKEEEEVVVADEPAAPVAAEMDLARFSLSSDDVEEVEYVERGVYVPQPREEEVEVDSSASDEGDEDEEPVHGASMPVRPVDLHRREEEEPEEDTGEPNVAVAEAAVAFLEGLLPLLEVEGEAVVRHTGSLEVEVELVGPDLGLLIGRYGATLDALQTVTAAAANRDVEEGARVVLDAEGYRERRLHSLESLARSTASRVKRGGREVALNNLQAHERRIIHMALRDEPDVETYSEGEGVRRRLIIAPRRGGRR